MDGWYDWIGSIMVSSMFSTDREHAFTRIFQRRIHQILFNSFSEAPFRRISLRKCPGGKVGGQKPTLRGQGDNLFQFLVKLQR